MTSKPADSDTSATTAAPSRRSQAALTTRETSVRRNLIDLGDIEDLQILNEHGEADDAFVPKLDDQELLRIHRAMVLSRKLDTRMLTMQRQGEMGTFAPGFGQEATQIGQIHPLQAKDWFSTSYRAFGAQLWRGWTIEGLMLLWDGFFAGFEIPDGVNDLPFSIVVGSHVPLAVGVAMGIRQRGDDAVTLTNFGDGAISQGCVNEAFNFAAVYKAPCIFICENNGWAISIPTERQSGIKELARRGPGFGVPSIRVDGNDVLGMIVATREAVQRARAGEGPTLIEAITYRMSLHTTADDPKVYRSEDEVEEWKSKDPIVRFEKYLSGKGLLDEAKIEAIADGCEQEVLAGRERFRELAKANPREVFDFVYEKLQPGLEKQKREYLAKLDRKGVE